jgi:hypothetical protein
LVSPFIVVTTVATRDIAGATDIQTSSYSSDARCGSDHVYDRVRARDIPSNDAASAKLLGEIETKRKVYEPRSRTT